LDDDDDGCEGLDVVWVDLDDDDGEAFRLALARLRDDVDAVVDDEDFLSTFKEADAMAASFAFRNSLISL